MRKKTNQIVIVSLVLTASVALNACNGSVENYKENPIDIISAFENPPEGEKENIKAIAEAQAKFHKVRYTDKEEDKLRNVHPKAHGCVNATFTINKNIAKELQVGLFSKPGYTYKDVKIRYSNATTDKSNDVDKETKLSRSRGMAIQIPHVKGTVIKIPGQTGTQDLLMINQPVFAIKDVADYRELTENQLIDEKSAVGKFLGINEKGKPTKHIRSAQIIGFLTSTPLANPLEAQYFSAAPFLFGKDRVMKFSAKPCKKPHEQIIPDDPSDNYLRQAMKKHLDSTNGEEACFDFLIQVPTDTENLGIEDATFEWIDDKTLIKEFPGKAKTGIPYLKVAQIIIPKQDFDTPENNEACEKLELNPWHSLVEHQPLGGINRLRNPVYLESAKGRK